MWLQSLRHSLLSLRRAPALTAVSVLTIGLGVGAGTALFSVVKAVLLNPLPYPAPDRLAWVTSLGKTGRETQTSLPDFDDWRTQNHSFASLAAFEYEAIVAGGGEAPIRTQGAIVTEQFFETLGVHPIVGREFSPQEQNSGAPLATVILSHSLWRRAYAGDPMILGRKITVAGSPSTVIGVMPPGFSFPAGTELWAPARSVGWGEQRTAHNYRVIGRLRPGTTVPSAAADIGAIARRLKLQYPGPFQTGNASARTLASHLTGEARTPLLVLFGAVGLLLLIVCVNVANLLLVRVTTRARELAVRTALGAQRRHLFGRLLLESLLLAAAGGATGLLLAAWSMDLLHVVLPASLPRVAEIRIDGGVIAFAIALSAATGIVFGTLPSWRAAGADLYDILKAGARGQTASRRAQRTQAALVISEVALSVVLLAGAGLLLASFERLRAVDPGFQPHGVLTADISFPSGPAAARLPAAYRDLLARTRSLAGVESAGTISNLPIYGPFDPDGHFLIESNRSFPAPDAGYLIVSPGYMEAAGIKLVRGRRFNQADVDSPNGVAMISESMARQFWPGRDPIGDRIFFDSFEGQFDAAHPKEHWLTIVGIVGDVRQEGLAEPAPSQAYVCYSQVGHKDQLEGAILVIRAHGNPAGLIDPVRTIVREVSPEAAASFRTMDDVMATATARQRFQMQVLGAFAALALILAAVGLYGVLSYAVTSNRAAIGVRIALGAQPAQVFRGVALQALALTAVGTAIGIVACVALRSVLARIVFGVGPSDPTVIAGASLLMAAVALLACWFPARRAMNVDSMAALRME